MSTIASLSLQLYLHQTPSKPRRFLTLQQKVSASTNTRFFISSDNTSIRSNITETSTSNIKRLFIKPRYEYIIIIKRVICLNILDKMSMRWPFKYLTVFCSIFVYNVWKLTKMLFLSGSIMPLPLLAMHVQTFYPSMGTWPY